MPGTDAVLVLTDQYDTTADHVIDELDRRSYPVFRCDLGQFPGTLTVTARFEDGWSGELRLADRRVALHDIGCAYYRRPTMPQFASTLTDGERHWARREAQRGLGGLLATLPRWLNHPQDIGRAEYKPLLQVAAASPKDHEVRLTVVDDALFAVRIDSASAAGHQDWRSDYPSLTYTVTDVPADVVPAVQRLMTRLGLRFGALDFVVGPNGAWTFLELNPNGQWAWLQDATGLPIASSIADALTRTCR